MTEPGRAIVSGPAGLRPLAFSPFEQLAGRPHVMVDGAPRPGSLVTLSHWPGSPTPGLLARDLSAEIAFAFVDWIGSPGDVTGIDPATAARLRDGAVRAEAVTCDHFDEDGLMSVLVLVDPQFAFERAGLICEVARCGDFGVVASEEAAQVAFAIEPLALECAGSAARAGQRYAAVLERLGDLLDRPGAYERYWSDEMALFAAGRDAIARGAVVVEELGDDLALVTRRSSERLAGAAGGMPVHASAVHSATAATRILAFDGNRCGLFMRYEGWVRYVSRPVAKRPDLGPLAAELSSLEPSGTRWEADGPAALRSGCRPAGPGESELAPQVVTELVRNYLRRAPVAFDPFA